MYSYITGSNKKEEFFNAVSGAAAYGVGELGGLIFTDICSSTATLTANQVRLIALAAEGGMHAVSQAYVAGLSGGDAGQGFRSALVSSAVASVTGGVNSFAGLSGTAGDISTMLFGSVSGGLSSKLMGGNFWEGAATGLTVSALNHVASKIAQPNKRPSKSNGRLERLERQGKVRALTENEMALAKSIFGDNIDYQSVKIVRAKYIFIQSKDYIMAPNGNIYSPTSPADWGTESEYSKSVFIHELVHVWQYQTGINVLWRALPLQILKFGTFGLINPYALPHNNINFPTLNVEQQGSYMQRFFLGKYSTNPFKK